MLHEEACVTISNAFNKKNEMAMSTGAREVFRYMVALINPHPQATPFNPVRDKLISIYGPVADDNNLLNAFQYIMEAGGKGGIHLQDLNVFYNQLVSPNERKLQMQA